MHQAPFEQYRGRLNALIEHSPGCLPFEQLALELFQWHFSANPAYRRFCERRNRTTVDDWRDIPALPTAAFKELEVTWLPLEQRTVVFHSSGTTHSKPSRHFHNAATLGLYEASLLPWFTAHVLGDPGTKFNFLALTPPPELAPHSSLVHMFATLRRRLPHDGFHFTARPDPKGAWQLDPALALATLEEARAKNRPIVLLGPAYAFVQLVDALPELPLPQGSRAMETGGYKGRSRTLSKSDLRRAIRSRFALGDGSVLGEYGMSELSSQAYDPDGIFRFPPWARVLIVSPETGREVAEGETGLIRVVDLANASSAPAVQTEDLGVRRGDGFEWIGRAEPAEERGCSLMMAGPAERDQRTIRH